MRPKDISNISFGPGGVLQAYPCPLGYRKCEAPTLTLTYLDTYLFSSAFNRCRICQPYRQILYQNRLSSLFVRSNVCIFLFQVQSKDLAINCAECQHISTLHINCTCLNITTFDFQRDIGKGKLMKQSKTHHTRKTSLEVQVLWVQAGLSRP